MSSISKLVKRSINYSVITQIRKCHNLEGMNKIIDHKHPELVTVSLVNYDGREEMINTIKQNYLREHAFARARNLCFDGDKAVDEYLLRLLEQGGSMCARNEDGKLAGFCVNVPCSPRDPKNLRQFAFKQEPKVKDLLYFTAKLQETPNLWKLFNEDNIFEIKMLTVLPEYRRQGLAERLIEKSKAFARDKGYKIVRFDCISPYDYKVAERCMMQCITRFPLHKLHPPREDYHGRENSKYSSLVRVYLSVEQRFKVDKMYNRNETRQILIE